MLQPPDRASRSGRRCQRPAATGADGQATAAALQRTDIEVLADAGYSSGEHLQKLQDCGMDVVLPPARAVNNHGDGTLYERSMFEYDRRSRSWGTFGGLGPQ